MIVNLLNGTNVIWDKQGKKKKNFGGSVVKDPSLIDHCRAWLSTEMRWKYWSALRNKFPNSVFSFFSLPITSMLTESIN